MKEMRVTLTMTEAMLGTVAGDPKVATEFLLSKNPSGVSKDEQESLPEDDLKKGSTIFFRDKETKMPFIYNYMIKGFFKTAAVEMCESDDFTKEALKKFGLSKWSHKKVVDRRINILGRRIYLELPEGTDPRNLDFLERPLRAETMRGDRVCLARSEVAPVGTKLTFSIQADPGKLLELVPWWLDFGQRGGLGQWNSGGMGQFSWEEIKS